MSGKGEQMKARWMAALSVLSVAAILGAGFAYVVSAQDTAGDTTTTTTSELKPLLTDQQLADLRAMMVELRANDTDMNTTMQLVEAQTEQYITENLQSYNLTDAQIAQVIDLFNAIDDKMTEIRETAYQLREQGATFDEIRNSTAAQMTELKSLQDQLVQTLNGYGISFNLPQAGHRGGGPGRSGPPGMGGPRPEMQCNCPSNCTGNYSSPQVTG